MAHRKSGEGKFAGFGRTIANCLDVYRLRLPESERSAFKQNEFVTERFAGKDPAWFSRIKMGHALPEPEEILQIAHALNVPVERFMHEASVYDPQVYQDVEGLIHVVEVDVMHPSSERQNILNCLRYSLSAQAKKQGWQKSTHKQLADFVLTRRDDAYTKAMFYADAVLMWYRDGEKERRLSRAERKTDEMLAVVS